ncbi:MFS transporter [Tumebacillus sp. DT12]|uniref:MFS transporter n=1 Tax=Tumebacillus lacus TaxID=2995335 RepID=A0ABT3X2Y7_9BACL|nr:MFS transporter [Tumebacillus lacus]MCX7571276.1 MFS transporter [Tumebacillus lacus]
MNPAISYKMLWLICLAHLINDAVTAIVPGLLPVFQESMDLNYAQLGVIVLVSTIAATLLQPFIGIVADQKPMPYLLPFGAALTCVGVVGLSVTESYGSLLTMAGLIGIGSAVFHPEASRAASMAAGPKKGLGQSIFQIGGNFGQSIGPLMIAWVFLPFGQQGALGFAVLPLLAIVTLLVIARWYLATTAASRAAKKMAAAVTAAPARYGALTLLVVVVVLRSWIQSGVASFLPLYLINDLGYSVETAQYFTFLFLFAGVIGTFVGGMMSDYVSRKKIVLFAMWGSIPFTLLMPHLDGLWLYVDVFLVGLISLSSFAVTVVYAQQLVPGKIGFVSGLVIGFAVGAGGVGASFMGMFADQLGIVRVIEGLALFPVLGVLLGWWLPGMASKPAPLQATGTLAN